MRARIIYVAFALWLSAFMLAVVLSPARGEIVELSNDEHLVRMLLQEAKDEPFDGIVAVAGVALDRVSDARWPDNTRDVLYQRWQFTAMAHPFGVFTSSQITQARAAAKVARMGARPCGKNVLWYHTPAVAPYWKHLLTEACRIGNHIFYKDR